MFGLFKSASVEDAQFGRLTHGKGMWRGEITVPAGARVPLILDGDKQAPSAAALAAARDFLAQYAAWQPSIAAALREHAAPYIEEADLDLRTDAAVWEQAAIQYVAVTALRDGLTLELGYAADWDEEHLLGARFRKGQLVELNGSVLPP